MRRAGRHFLQIPGPTNVPDRILRAMDMPTMDHRGPEFAELGRRVLDGMRTDLQDHGPVVIYPASGTGAWEAALVNTLSPGDHVLMYETGHFATLWKAMASGSGCEAEFIQGDWRAGADPDAIERAAARRHGHSIKAVCVVHNETSTGCVSRDRRGAAGDRRRRASGAAHGRHDLLARLDRLPARRMGRRRHRRRLAEGADAAAGPLLQRRQREGAGRLAIGASCRNPSGPGRRCCRPTQNGFFPYTPATNLLYGLAEAIDMLHEEGLDNVFARHQRHAEATRRAVRAWGLEVFCREPRHYSGSLTAVLMPDGHSADAFRQDRRSRPSTCRSAAACPSSPTRCSASAISAISTI